MIPETDYRHIVDALRRLGYGPELLRHQVQSPTSGLRVGVLAFYQLAPQDLRTSAFGCDVARNVRDGELARRRARELAAPFSLIERKGKIELYRIGLSSDDDALLASVDANDPTFPNEFLRDLAPEALRHAKAGSRQLSLFPVDVRLLDNARRRTTDTLSRLVARAFAQAAEDLTLTPVDAARAVIGSLAAAVVRDKEDISAPSNATLLVEVASRHPQYFANLQKLFVGHTQLWDQLIGDLGSSIDFSMLDARTINSVYESLLVTPAVRKQLGIFYTPPELATQILDALPIESVRPEQRIIFDPACGSGNLLLAAIERLDNLTSDRWTALERHDWLHTRIRGSDVDPIAAEIGRLSLLNSSLPLGNDWTIDEADHLTRAPNFTPSIIVANPPWRNQKGSREERAIRFLDASINALGDDGLLACVMPATWLSSNVASKSREFVASQSDLFEVWRLPRDVFGHARYPAAVIFLRKRPRRAHQMFAYRWVIGGVTPRHEFLGQGTATFSLMLRQPRETSASAPLTGWIFSHRQPGAHPVLNDVAHITSGLVQATAPTPTKAGKLQYLPRGAQYAVYREVSPDSLIRVKSVRDTGSSPRVIEAFVPNQVLIQAHWSPDMPWRVRPVFDRRGILPSDSWIAIRPISATALEAFALFAYMSSSIASSWVASTVASKRINMAAVGQLPLLPNWEHLIPRLARLGEDLLATHDLSATLTAVEEVCIEGFKLHGGELNALRRLMASSIAPEGSRRELPIPNPLEDQVHLSSPGPGAVLRVEGSKLKVWILGGPEDGTWIDLPSHMPGWLATEGATFEFVGQDLESGSYHLHSAAFRSEEELVGVDRGPD